METETIREAVAVFDQPEALEEAISALQSSGVDRADLSILAPAHSTEPQNGNETRTAGHSLPPREAVVSDTDLRQGRVLGTGLMATIAAFAAAGMTVATGGVAAATVAAAAVAGGVGVLGTLIGRQLADEHTAFLDAQLAAGGVLLWVRTRDPGIERTVLDVLRRHSAKVSIHDRTVGDARRGASSEANVNRFGRGH
jgi:hypothetical protein